MLSALLYLQSRSFINRLVSRVKRLKQPKYLVGGIVGAVYFYFYFFRYVFGIGVHHPHLATLVSPEDVALFESLGALFVLLIIVLAWFIPHERAALVFSEAEVAFLFPAPISRRGLIHFKLVRSQLRILFTTILLALVSHRFGGHPWLRAAGWWLILSTLNLHFLGSSFARTMLLDRGITNWQRRSAILLLLAIVVAAVAIWARHSLPNIDPVRLDNLDTIKDYARALLASGPVPWLLYPCRLIILPFLAPGSFAFLLALGPCLLLLGLHYVWVIRSNVAFEEASLEASKRLADKVAAIRAGNFRAADKPRKSKAPPFVLRPTGPQPVALLWKNLISVGHGLTLRLWLTLAVVSIAFSIALQPVAAHSGALSILGMVACMLIVWSIVIGPQLFRQDFRQDLPVADVLKCFPMRGWQIALGEILAPAVVLTALQWFLLIVAAGLLWNNSIVAFGKPLRLGIVFGLAILLPALNLITLQIPNAAVLLFPGWFQVSKDGAHGIEATGQRLIFMLGQLLAFLVVIAPAAAAALAAFFILNFTLGPALAVPLAALAATVLLAGEAALGLILLGFLFNRLDLSTESGP